MPFTLANVKQRTSTVSVPIEGETLNVTYNRSAYTPGMVARLRSTSGKGDQAEVEQLVEMLCALIEEWDFVDEKGKPVAVEAAVLRELPFWFLNPIMEAIQEDAFPNAKTAANTGSFS